jgi:hypothetical protein
MTWDQLPFDRWCRVMRLVAPVAFLSAVGACASTGAARPDPVVLAERCDRGPFCVTGEVDDQFSTAVEGVKCLALREDGGTTTVVSDKRGVFFLDGLATLPHQVRFEKPGFASQTVPVFLANSSAGAVARVYVIFHRIADSECSCEPSAILAGHEPCSDDKCGRSQFDVTIPESKPAAP